jgi:hypothetical protein
MTEVFPVVVVEDGEEMISDVTVATFDACAYHCSDESFSFHSSLPLEARVHLHSILVDEEFPIPSIDLEQRRLRDFGSATEACHSFV